MKQSLLGLGVSIVSKGKEFEDEVADLCRLMGYEVKQNVTILGHQFDLILPYAMAISQLSTVQLLSFACRRVWFKCRQ